jgi:hypothetical protein
MWRGAGLRDDHDRMKRSTRTEVGREAPMVITPRRLGRLLGEVVRVFRDRGRRA